MVNTKNLLCLLQEYLSLLEQVQSTPEQNKELMVMIKEFKKEKKYETPNT